MKSKLQPEKAPVERKHPQPVNPWLKSPGTNTVYCPDTDDYPLLKREWPVLNLERLFLSHPKEHVVVKVPKTQQPDMTVVLAEKPPQEALLTEVEMLIPQIEQGTKSLRKCVNMPVTLNIHRGSSYNKRIDDLHGQNKFALSADLNCKQDQNDKPVESVEPAPDELQVAVSSEEPELTVIQEEQKDDFTREVAVGAGESQLSPRN